MTSLPKWHPGRVDKQNHSQNESRVFLFLSTCPGCRFWRDHPFFIYDEEDGEERKKKQQQQKKNQQKNEQEGRAFLLDFAWSSFSPLFLSVTRTVFIVQWRALMLSTQTSERGSRAPGMCRLGHPQTAGRPPQQTLTAGWVRHSGVQAADRKPSFKAADAGGGRPEEEVVCTTKTARTLKGGF